MRPTDELGVPKSRVLGMEFVVGSRRTKTQELYVLANGRFAHARSVTSKLALLESEGF